MVRKPFDDHGKITLFLRPYQKVQAPLIRKSRTNELKIYLFVPPYLVPALISDLDFNTNYSNVDASLEEGIRNNDYAATQWRQLLPEHSPLKSSTRACVNSKGLTPDYPKLTTFMVDNTCHNFQVTFIILTDVGTFTF